MANPIRVRELADGWLNGSLTDEEIREFLLLLDREDSTLSNEVLDWLADPGLAALADYSRTDVLFKKIMEQAGREQTSGATVKRLYRRPAVAAAAVILLVAGLWFIQRPHAIQETNTASNPPAHDAPPGGNKAILTLSGGQQIILDSARIGALAQQGNATVSKTDSGQLVYEQQKHNTTAILYNTLSTPRGGQYQLTLPDGSRVWLNAASSVTYPTTFAGVDRVVRVTGEAYFEVAADARRPFRVKVGDTSIQVLGTTFNVNAYKDELAMRVTLLTGKVEVSAGGTLILQPGQQAVVTNRTELVEQVDTAAVMAWKNGLFSFEHTDLTAILRQLARWYDVEVKYEGNQPRMSFSGKIRRSLTLSQTLELLTQYKVHYTIDDNHILTIRP